jgi:hypothetical protein
MFFQYKKPPIMGAMRRLTAMVQAGGNGFEPLLTVPELGLELYTPYI